MTPRRLVAMAVAVLDAVGAERAVLVGHDWGALIAYVAAALDPERISAIITLGIPHPSLLLSSPAHVLWAARHFVALKLPGAPARCRRNDFAYFEQLYRRWAPGWSGSERDQTLERAKQALAAEATLAAAISYYRDATAAARAPADPCPQTAGPDRRRDGGRRESRVLRAHRRADGADSSRALIARGAGHWPHREQPELVISELMSFVADVRTG